MTPPSPTGTGRVAVVTGGNSGIGLETATALAAHGDTVLMAARDASKGAAAVDRVRAATGAGDRVQLGSLDLASVRSVRAFADDVLERFDRLDVLVNNAGLILQRPTTTELGVEATFAVNHLGPFLLTNLLLDRMRVSAPARIVNVASVAHHYARRSLRHDDPATVPERYRSFRVYSRSKLANVLFTRELQRRLHGSGVTATCLHPGNVRTHFGGEGDHRFLGVLIALFGRVTLISPERGARTSVFLATVDDPAPYAGQYVVRRRVHKGSRLSRADDEARWLWERSEHLLDAADPS